MDLWTIHRWSWGSIFPHGLLQKNDWEFCKLPKKQLFILKNILKFSRKLCCVGWWLLKFHRNTVHYILRFKETYPKWWIVAQCAALLVGVRCVWQVDFVDSLLCCLTLWTDTTGSHTFKALNEFTCEIYSWNGLITK